MTGAAGTLPPASGHAGGQHVDGAGDGIAHAAGAILPGHQAMVGTRTPPSQVLPLPPRSGPALPPSAPLMSQGPLSLVKTTSVFRSSFSSRSVSSTRPTLQSTSSTQSPKRPFCDLPRNFLAGMMGVCTAVCGK
jgi:hypothetical protein